MTMQNSPLALCSLLRGTWHFLPSIMLCRGRAGAGNFGLRRSERELTLQTSSPPWFKAEERPVSRRASRAGHAVEKSVGALDQRAVIGSRAVRAIEAMQNEEHATRRDFENDSRPGNGRSSGAGDAIEVTVAREEKTGNGIVSFGIIEGM